MQKKPFKILYIITQGEWGGAQRYLFDLTTGLAGEFEIIVAVGEKDGKNDLQNKLQITNYKLQINNKIQIIKLKYLKRAISPIHDILAIFELAKLYRKIKPDIIHLNSSKAGVIGSLAKFVNSLFLLPSSFFLVYTVHGWVFNEPSRKLGRWLYRFLEKLTARWKDKIIVLSDKDFADGIKFGIDEKKLIKIPLGIDRPEFLSKEDARQFLDPRLRGDDIVSGDDIVIGTIANLYKTKGLDVLIDAVHILSLRAKRSNPHTFGIASSPSAPRNDMRVIIIGEGPERKNLESKIMNYELGDTVHLAGTIENAAQYLPAFDLFVLPSRKEGLPYTLLEAMAAKAPIIAADAGGVSELIENKKMGLIVQPENPQELAEAIVYALENPQEMRIMAENAFAKIQKFNLQQMLNKTIGLYQSLLN